MWRADVSAIILNFERRQRCLLAQQYAGDHGEQRYGATNTKSCRGYSVTRSRRGEQGQRAGDTPLVKDGRARARTRARGRGQLRVRWVWRCASAGYQRLRRLTASFLARLGGRHRALVC